MNRTSEEYFRWAEDWVNAYEGEPSALERLNAYYEHTFTFADLKAEIWRRIYAFRERSSRVPKNYLQLSEAQLILAQDAGFGSWAGMISAVVSGTPAPSPIFDFDAGTAHCSASLPNRLRVGSDDRRPFESGGSLPSKRRD